MELQAQAAVTPGSVDQAYLADQATYDGYKKHLTEIRLKRIDVVQQLKGQISDIDALSKSRDDVIGMFKSEAMQMYPDLAGRDIGQVLPQLAMNHPLLQLWDQYADKINTINNKMFDSLQLLSDTQATDTDLAKQEADALNQYAAFQALTPTPLPSVSDLLANLQAVEVIPMVDESSTIVSMNAIEDLNPEAAAILANELADKMPADDATDDEDEQTKTQMQSMQYSQEGKIRQGLTAAEALDASAVVSADQLAQPNFKRLGYGLAVVTLAYMIFGKGK